MPTPEAPTPSGAVAAPAPTKSRQSATRTALAGAIGNVLEWFDFAVFGYFATEIGKQFFPSRARLPRSCTRSSVFGVGFVGAPDRQPRARPDRRSHRPPRPAHAVDRRDGRCDAAASACCRPTRRSASLAPVLLVTAAPGPGLLARRRVHRLDGLHDRARVAAWRGLVSSSTAAGTTLGFILGSGSVRAARQRALTAQRQDAWGWRVPFIASASFWSSQAGSSAAGMQARPRKARRRRDARPARRIARRRIWRPMLQTFGIVAMTNAAYYLTFTFAVERRKAHPGADHSDVPVVQHADPRRRAALQAARRLAVGPASVAAA